MESLLKSILFHNDFFFNIKTPFTDQSIAVNSVTDQLTKTEALSGRQHVVLWLTRTSMAEVPSVPSLRNLVASSVMTKSRRNSTENPIQRNFSTKSFSKYDTKEVDPPMR